MCELKQRKILDSFIENIKDVFAHELLQIILFNDKDPYSDDILIIMKSFDLNKMKKTHALVKKITSKNFSAPLFMTPDFINSSLDSYPLEFLNMQNDYLNLYLHENQDYIKNLKFDKENLRLQIERELKGKHLLISSNYISFLNSKKILNELINKSILSLKPVLKGILFVNDKNISPLGDELLESVQQTLNLDLQAMNKAFNICFKKDKFNDLNLDTFFDNYLKEIENLYNKIDNM